MAQRGLKYQLMPDNEAGGHPTFAFVHVLDMRSDNFCPTSFSEYNIET